MFNNEIVLAIKPNNNQMVTHSSTVIRTPSQSNLHLQKTAVPKIDLVLFDWREHALSCKSFFSVLTAKQFILKTTKNNPAYVSLIIVPADSLSLSPPLLCAIFSCPQDPPCSCLSFSLSSFLPHSLLFGSAAALEDAWHLSIICTQEDHTKGRWVQQRVDRQMSKRGNE